ncbi:hypothetical protein OKW11_004623 [Pseudomonas baetica]|nr:hypothetical protein [Pseudomonas baetica]
MQVLPRQTMSKLLGIIFLEFSSFFKFTNIAGRAARKSMDEKRKLLGLEIAGAEIE